MASARRRNQRDRRQHASDSAYAWNQNFNNGNQNYWHKDNKNRAVAVRS